MQLQTAPVLQSIHTFLFSLANPLDFLQPSISSRGRPRARTPIVGVRVRCCAWGNIWHNVRQYYTENREFGCTITVRVGQTTVRAFGGVVRGRLCTCHHPRCRLLLWWSSWSAPGTSSTSSASSTAQSAMSSSSTIARLRVGQVVACLARCCTRRREHYGSYGRVTRLLLHSGDHISYFGHVGVDGRVVSGCRVASGA